MINLLDLMSEEDKSKALTRFKRRMERSDKFDNRIPNEVYIVAEFGYYFGWEGIRAIRNDEITLAEANALLEGARKVWYAKLVEQARAGQISTGSVFSKHPNDSFKKGIKPFAKRSEP